MKTLFIALLLAGIASGTENSSPYKEYECETWIPRRINAQGKTDNLWTKAGGDMKLIQLIVDMNSLKDPDLIIAGKPLWLPCIEKEELARATKQFIAPEIKVTVPTVTLIELPQVQAQLAIASPTIPITRLSAPKPQPVVVKTDGDSHTAEELALVSPEITHAFLPAIPMETQPQVQTEAKAEVKPAKTKNTPTAKKKSAKQFEVTFIATGVKPGLYPAIFLSNQDKKGLWHSRKNMSIVVEEIEGRMLCRIMLERKPAINSAAVIDWGGQAFYISGDILANGAVVETRNLKSLSRKAYRPLQAEFPVKRHPIRSVLRILLPTVLKSGLAFATIGPAGVILAPVSIGTDLLANRIRSAKGELMRASAPRLEIQYQMAGQTKDIETLRNQIATLKSQLDKLQQAVKEVSTKDAN